MVYRASYILPYTGIKYLRYIPPNAQKITNIPPGNFRLTFSTIKPRIQMPSGTSMRISWRDITKATTPLCALSLLLEKIGSLRNSVSGFCVLIRRHFLFVVCVIRTYISLLFAVIALLAAGDHVWCRPNASAYVRHHDSIQPRSSSSSSSYFRPSRPFHSSKLFV